MIPTSRQKALAEAPLPSWWKGFLELSGEIRTSAETVTSERVLAMLDIVTKFEAVDMEDESHGGLVIIGILRVLGSWVASHPYSDIDCLLHLPADERDTLRRRVVDAVHRVTWKRAPLP